MPKKKKSTRSTKGSKKTESKYKTLKLSIERFKALNHDFRQEVLDLLNFKGRLTVTDIYIAMRVEQSVASQHLKILRRAKIVGTERAGKNIYYFVIPENNSEFLELADQVAVVGN